MITSGCVSVTSVKGPEGWVCPLPWDSRHFGFPVGRIDAPDLDDHALRSALEAARGQRYVLLYWTTTEERAVPEWLIAEYHGRLVDWKITFAANLDRGSPDAAIPHPQVSLEAYPPGPACPELKALAIAAGLYSRFFADPRIPRRAAEDLYGVWIDKSARRELADDVLVARKRGAGGKLAGMVTVSLREGLGSIGLSAVRQECRGQGIGACLIAASHVWMRARGASRSEVVTQRANTPACRLYARCGYSVKTIRRVYHFWLATPPVQ